MKDMNERLFESCGLGDVKTVKELLDAGADIETRCAWGSTPLTWACVHGNTEIVKLLLERGSCINVKNNSNWTPLLYACLNWKKEVIMLLLEYGADINAYDNYGKSCLGYNVSVWQEEYVQELIISKQPRNIKLLDGGIGILQSLREKYKEIIDLSAMCLI